MFGLLIQKITLAPCLDGETEDRIKLGPVTVLGLLTDEEEKLMRQLMLLSRIWDIIPFQWIMFLDAEVIPDPATETVREEVLIIRMSREGVQGTELREGGGVAGDRNIEPDPAPPRIRRPVPSRVSD